MFGDYDEIIKIKKLLEENMGGLSISEISQSLGIHRTTAAKYLDILQMKGDVTLKIRGTSKMYQLSNRVPSSSIKTIHDGTYMHLGQNLEIRELSPGFNEIFDIKEEIIGRNINEKNLASIINNEIKKGCKQALSGVSIVYDHSAIIKRDQKHLKIRIIPIIFDDGKPGCSVLFSDNTKYKIADFKSEICEQELIVLTQDMKEFVFTCTPDGLLTRVNDRFCARMNKKPEELISFPYEHVISHEDLERLTELKKGITKISPKRIISFKAIQSDGMVAWEEWTYRGLYSKDGTATGFLAIGQDITDLHHMKEQLETYHASFEGLVKQRTREMRQANQDLISEISRRERIERELLIIQAAFDHASDSIILFERSGKVWRANDTSCRLLGYTKDEMADVSVFSINPEITSEMWDMMWSDAEADGKITRVRSSHRRSDETIIPVELSRTFIRAGPVILFCSIAREINIQIHRKSKLTKGI